MTTAGLEDMMKRIETLEKRVDVHSEPPFDRLSQMSLQTDNLVKLHEATSMSLGQIQRTGVNTQDRTLRMTNIVSKVELDVTFMRTDLAATHEDVNDLVSTVKSLGQQVGEVKKDVKGLKEGQEGLQQDVKGLKEGQESLQQDVKGLKEGQESLQQDVTELKDGQNSLQEGFKSLQEGFKTLHDGQNSMLTLMTELVRQR
jgi:chromosome segregation ATPase